MRASARMATSFASSLEQEADMEKIKAVLEFLEGQVEQHPRAALITIAVLAFIALVF